MKKLLYIKALKRSLFLLAILLGTLIISESAFARTYKVEMIVFKHDNNTAIDESNHASSNSLAEQNLKHAQLASQSKNIGLRNSLSILAKTRARLDQNGYRIISTKGWLQKSQPWSKAPVMSIRDNERVIKSGFVRVYSTSLLFVDVDILFSRDPHRANTDLVSDQFTTLDFNQDLFYISEKRRLKLKEIHYFDHPVYGVILTVWPIKK